VLHGALSANGWRAISVFPPGARDSTFPPTLAPLSIRRPPTLSWRVDSPSSLPSSSECCDLQPASLSVETDLAASPSGEAPPLEFGSPSSRRQLAASTRCTEVPAPRYGPSSAFRTPSTVCSAAGLAGLFHPAAASRVCPSGGCSSPRSRAGFLRPLPSCRWTGSSAVARADFPALDFRALLSRASALERADG